MAQAAKKTNWFAIWVTAGVVIALVLVTVLVVVLNNAAAPKPLPTEVNTPSASNIDAETGAIHVGDGADNLATYVDFMCPICGQFESTFGEQIDGLVSDGSITLDIHPISILDSQSQGTQYSTRAANAMYCVAVADADKSLPFLQQMFAQQPTEGSKGLTNKEMLAIASDVGVSGIDSCVNDGTYAGYITEITQKTPIQEGASGIGTPTVVANGELVPNQAVFGTTDVMTWFQ
ncbi:DsbA family protein [Microbacterium jejuense]|uniref:DsbA family protein n=1 Tax=Microbacterium jejuense TaxID=1263637 RepID=UPI0031E82068